MVSKESHLCRCCDMDVFISCCTKVVSFGDIISGVVFESLSLDGLLVQLLFRGLSVVFGDCSIDICFHIVEDWRNGYNWPRFQLFNTRRIIISGFASYGCWWLVSLIGCTRFGFSSTFVGVPCDYAPILNEKFVLLALVGEFSPDFSF